ncbi:MAG TPA: uroporphyrinogen decarboxylase [Acidimicrobiales bacterium]|nr:uroporphyrinogen decarboxylase [Acidimicrobiales bacterium]
MSSAAPRAAHGPAPEPGRFDDAPFVRSCRSQPVDHVPVWFMRQAGRSLPEYRAARGEGSILEAIARPELVAELTRQPVDRYGTDAAIFFSDIVVPAAAVGFGVDVAPGTGPVVDEPLRTAGDLQRLRPLEPELDTPYVIDAVRLLADTLKVPLIGFAGGPFTVASYLIEGGPSREHTKTKRLMYGAPDLWNQLVTRLADVSLASLRDQIEAGAEAIQLFDSWAGILSPGDYERLVLPATRTIFAGLAESHPGTPSILYGLGTGELLPLMATSGASVIGVDWRVPLDVARGRIGPGLAVQGNLDPALCVASWDVAAAATREVLASAGTAPGHIFNLGHGVLPETDPSILERVCELVHAEGRAGVGVVG